MNEFLLEQGVIGKRVEAFLNSDVGKYLVGRAEEEAANAAEALKRVAPWRTRRVRELQNQIHVAESVQAWLGQAIADGIQATYQLENDHE